ncbi:YhgE/Pip domain-containing protein [Actinomyces weissii]|uniref:YhgE/Pip domain-containing protein n=1 Tax=Actinomyces weissii TaxID=675090 RepID=A0A7T7S1Y8_9ACTO|nr:YhgE/Pip domain-containing protein [Actinomyces weissii]QQM67441.1 YhgE/Pip domain-containing protein [Actinomyces weissii]
MKKLTGSRASNLVVVLAVVIVPLLYAGLLTLTYQDPTNRLGDMTAAVVNDDTAYTATLASGSTETLSLGADLTQALTQPEEGTDVGFRWQAMSAQEAERGLRTEEVRAILYIPADFSQQVAAVGQSDPSAAATQSLRLVTDDGVNYLTGTMATTVAEKLTSTLQAQGSEKVLSSLLLSVSTIRDGMSQASTGASAVATGAATLADGSKTASDGADSLSEGAATLQVGIKDLADGSVRLDDALQALSTGASQAGSGSAALADGLSTIAQGSATASSSSTRLASGASTVKDGASALAQGTQTLADSTGTLSTGTSALASGAGTLADGVQAYTQGVDQVASGASRLQHSASALADGLATTKADGTPGLAGATAALADGLATTKADGTPGLAGATAALADGLATTKADGTPGLAGASAALADGLATTKADGTPGLAGAVSTYTGSVDALAATCREAGDSSATCTALQQLSSQSGTLTQAVSTAATSAESLSAGATRSATAASTLADGAARASQGANALDGATTALAQQVGSPQDLTVPGSPSSPQTLLGGVNALAGGLQQVTSATVDGVVVPGGSSQALRQGATSLSAGLGSLNGQVPDLISGVSALNDGASNLAQGTSSLSQGADALSTGLGRLQQGTYQAADSAGQLRDGLSRLDTGASQAAAGSSTLRGGLDQAQTGSTSLADGASSLADGVQKLEDGSATLSTGASSLATGLNDGVDKIPAYNEAQRSTVAQTASAVAQVEAVRENGVANNGAGFAPMFMSLALWIGGIALFLVLPALDKRDHGERWWASAVRPATTALLLAVAQAVIMMLVVNAAGELHAANLLGLCLMAVATSVCFMAVNQACVAALAFRGRFISIILLSLQITSMGATFPIETAPRFFQWIHPWLPMSYTQLAFRELIAGAGADAAVAQALVVLAAWTLVAVLVILLGARIRRGPRPLPADNALAPTAA